MLIATDDWKSVSCQLWLVWGAVTGSEKFTCELEHRTNPETSARFQLSRFVGQCVGKCVPGGGKDGKMREAHPTDQDAAPSSGRRPTDAAKIAPSIGAQAHDLPAQTSRDGRINARRPRVAAAAAACAFVA
jgi:hypothetical protein